MYVILQYVIFERKLLFDQELKIEKLSVSDICFVFELRIHGTFSYHN